jgi:hypothetical protein
MDLESEQFMTLLTDALRAGPGSPEWHQAVGVLRASGGDAQADEYQMLVRAREDLESGRDYRAVRAGAGFTRNVMSGIEEEAKAGPKGLPSANFIALIASGVVLALVVVLAVVLLKNPPPADRGEIERLQGIYFINPVALLNFENGSEIGPEWELVGEMPLKVNREKLLAPDKQAAGAATQGAKDDKREYRTGAVVLAESIAPTEARMLDVTLKVKGQTNDQVIPEVFVSEGRLDDARASSGRELVWLLKGGTGQVALADGRVPGQGEKVDVHKPHTLNIKMRFNRDTVIVESGDKRLYEGPHKLSETGPRYVGVRFRRKVGDTSDGVGLVSVSVLKP